MIFADHQVIVIESSRRVIKTPRNSAIADHRDHRSVIIVESSRRCVVSPDHRDHRRVESSRSLIIESSRRSLADLRGEGARGPCPPPRCQRWHLNNPSTAKSRQLLGDFVPQTPYRGSAAGPRWGTPWIGPRQVHFLDTIRYNTRCYFNVRSKADMSRLNLPHENDN